MNKEYLQINTLESNGKLYKNNLLGTIEALIPNPFDSCHAADLLELPNRDLLCCWFAGSDEGNADINIALSRLDKDSSQWSIPFTISDDLTRSEQNPSLFMPDEKEVWVMYTAQKARTKELPLHFNLQYTAEIRRRKSFDDGRTWNNTDVMFPRPGSFCRQKIQVLSSGRWIFGNWICFNDQTRNGSDITEVQISDDQGKSWKTVEIPESNGRVHANLLEIKPGHLIALFRSRFADNIYISSSYDSGDTWAPPERTELRNNNSSISAVVLKSGSVALIYNDVSFNSDTSKTIWPNQRCPVTIAISCDAGTSWPYRRIVENGEGFIGPLNDINNRRYEYPVIMQGRDGIIHLAYTWGSRKNIKYVSIDEDWIRGKQECPGAENDPSMPCRR